MSVNPKKRIAPTLVDPSIVPTENFQKKKNPIESTADLIAMRYGVSAEAPKIDEEVFEQNRAVGKKVVPLKAYFEQTAKEFVQKEAEKKEENVRKKREYAKLTPCERKIKTLQRNIDGYVKDCNQTISNEAVIEMVDKARDKIAKTSIKKQKTKKVKMSGGRTKQCNTYNSLGGSRKNKNKKSKKRWSLKYKKSINCKRPRGFSQRQYCKYGRK